MRPNPFNFPPKPKEFIQDPVVCVFQYQKGGYSTDLQWGQASHSYLTKSLCRKKCTFISFSQIVLSNILEGYYSSQELRETLPWTPCCIRIIECLTRYYFHGNIWQQFFSQRLYQYLVCSINVISIEIVWHASRCNYAAVMMVKIPAVSCNHNQCCIKS